MDAPLARRIPLTALLATLILASSHPVAAQRTPPNQKGAAMGHLHMTEYLAPDTR